MTATYTVHIPASLGVGGSHTADTAADVAEIVINSSHYRRILGIGGVAGATIEAVHLGQAQRDTITRNTPASHGRPATYERIITITHRAPATPIHKAGKPVTSTITLTMGQDDAPETEWTWAPDGRGHLVRQAAAQ
jgi:hypothetical protein